MTLNDQRGQATVLSVVFLAVLLGMAALVLDVGSWYQADRYAQTTADAAALAGAQGLNESPAKAMEYALAYGAKNGGGVAAANVVLTASTVKVTVNRSTPGFFAKLFGLDSVNVRATATARIGPPATALGVAPIVVNEANPDLLNFGKEIELSYDHLKASGSSDGAGSFGFINLIPGGSNPSTGTLGGWIRNGLDSYMDIGLYNARTGNPFSSTAVEAALKSKLGEVLLFPIYRTLTETGSGANYDIVGWVGFELTGLKLSGTDEILKGKFTKVIWQGVQGATGASKSPGVGIVQLVE
jgi:hypothetical protein